MKHPIPFRTRKVNPHVALLVLFDTGEEVEVKKKMRCITLLLELKQIYSLIKDVQSETLLYIRIYIRKKRGSTRDVLYLFCYTFCMSYAHTKALLWYHLLPKKFSVPKLCFGILVHVCRNTYTLYKAHKVQCGVTVKSGVSLDIKRCSSTSRALSSYFSFYVLMLCSPALPKQSFGARAVDGLRVLRINSVCINKYSIIFLYCICHS